ncbi:hypothetical protein SUGI_0652600 [Cryptomeria japonica]|nr:hypothetical protein SUGI_0652600 [Cryptomeria japonica]
MASFSEDHFLVIMKMAKCDEEVGVKKLGRSPSHERPRVNLRLLRRSLSLDAADLEKMDILWEEHNDVPTILRSEPCKTDGTKPCNRDGTNMEMISSNGLVQCRHVLKNSWVKTLRRTGIQKSKSFAKIFGAFKMIVLINRFRSRKIRTEES